MKEKVKMLYEKYQKLFLTRAELAQEIGMKKSTIDKILSPGSGPGKKIIIKNNILPQWTMIGSRMRWSLEAIVIWTEGTEKVA